MRVTASGRTWADIGGPDAHFSVPKIRQIQREKVGSLDRRLLCGADLAQGDTGSQDGEKDYDNLLHRCLLLFMTSLTSTVMGLTRASTSC